MWKGKEEEVFVPLPPGLQQGSLRADVATFCDRHGVSAELRSKVGGCSSSAIVISVTNGSLPQAANSELVALLRHHGVNSKEGWKSTRAHTVRLRVDPAAGAGLDLEWCWNGFSVLAVDMRPGQHRFLEVGSTILAIQGRSLRFASEDNCNDTFGQYFSDGALLIVSPPRAPPLWEVRLPLHGHAASVLGERGKEQALRADLCAFSDRHQLPAFLPCSEDPGSCVCVIGDGALLDSAATTITRSVRAELHALLAHHLAKKDNAREPASLPRNVGGRREADVTAAAVAQGRQGPMQSYGQDKSYLSLEGRRTASAPLSPMASSPKPANGLRPTLSSGPHMGTGPAIRTLRLRFDRQGRAGLELVWQGESGFVVAAVDESPGQPGLRAGDLLVAVAGRALTGLATEAEANAILGEQFVNGVAVSVVCNAGTIPDMGDRWAWGRQEASAKEQHLEPIAPRNATKTDACDDRRRVLSALHNAMVARDIDALEAALAEAYASGIAAMSVGFAERTLRELQLERLDDGQHNVDKEEPWDDITYPEDSHYREFVEEPWEKLANAEHCDYRNAPGDEELWDQPPDAEHEHWVEASQEEDLHEDTVDAWENTSAVEDTWSQHDVMEQAQWEDAPEADDPGFWDETSEWESVPSAQEPEWSASTDEHQSAERGRVRFAPSAAAGTGYAPTRTWRGAGRKY